MSDEEDDFEDKKLADEVDKLLIDDDEEVEEIATPLVKDDDEDGEEEDEGDDYDDDEEDDQQKIRFVKRISAQESRMSDVMSTFTLSALIIARSGTLARGAQAFVKMKNGSRDPTLLAKAEIVHGVCPRAALMDNVVWKINDYVFFPADFIAELSDIKAASEIV